MRLGQQLKVRKFADGGIAQDNCEAAGGTWTGATCDMAGATGHEMTNVGGLSGSQFEHLSGMTSQIGGENMANYLQQTYGLQDPENYLASFEAYDPLKEQNLKKSYQFGMGEAQTGAREKMGDIYSQARSAGAKGGGFGGKGKTLAKLKGKTLSGLESQQEKMSKTFTGGVQGLREDYVGDWLGQVGKLGQMGATFCQPGTETWVPDPEEPGGGSCKPNTYTP